MTDYKKVYKNVYIVLTQTKTYPARVIHYYTKEPYAHASLAFDEELKEMYSFARKGIWNPFNAGFICEDINSGIFARHKSTTCSIYSLKITKTQYTKLRKVIDMFKQNKDKYSYNYIGLLAAAVNVPIKSEQRYFCSQFVAYALEQSDINIFSQGYEFIKPKDFRLNPNMNLIFEGKLSDYRLKNNSLVLQ